MRAKRRTLHPLASLGDPPAIRLVNATVMRGEWTDPDDIRPTAARTARTITGYRTFCPLRRMMRIPGASVTLEHIAAADRLRATADAVAIGFSGRRELVPIQAIPAYGPVSGPGQAALRTAAAWPVYRAAMGLFCPEQRSLIAHVILRNKTVNRWCEDQRERGLAVQPQQQMGRLLAILDVLTEHFKTDVEAAIARGVAI